MPERMERIVAGVASAMDVACELDYHWSYPPTINDAATNDVVREVGRAVLGAENVVEHDLVMWAEDMSFMHERRPGAYFVVGARGGASTSFHAPQRALRHRRALPRGRVPHDGRARSAGLRALPASHRAAEIGRAGAEEGRDLARKAASLVDAALFVIVEERDRRLREDAAARSVEDAALPAARSRRGGPS